MSEQQKPVGEVIDWDECILARYVEYLPTGTSLYTAEYAEALRRQRDELLVALKEIAYLRKPGPLHNKQIEQMERIAIAAIAKAKEQA